MRDPKRIDAILATLGEAWKANPDMRLGQLLVCAATPVGAHSFQRDLFYIEDDETLRGLQTRFTQTLKT